MACRIVPNFAAHCVFGIVVLLRLAQPVDGQERQPFRQAASQGQDATFSIGKHGEPIFIPITIGEEAVHFSLNSRTSHHMIDQRYKSVLGKCIRIINAGTPESPVNIEVFHSPQLLLGKLSIKSDRPVFKMDLSPLSQVHGRDIHGILGASFFLNHVIQLDFDRRIMRLLESSDPPPKSWGVAFPLGLGRGSRPYIHGVTIDGETTPFLVDTGLSSAVTLSQTDFERLISSGSIKSVRTAMIRTMSGDVQIRTGQLKSIRLGPFEHHSVRVMQTDSNSIGLEYLNRFCVTIDFSGRRLYLARGDLYAAATNTYDKSGLSLLWIKKRIVVVRVKKDSPAQRAGIVKGDILLEFNGEPATGAKIHQLRRTLRGKAGHEIHLITLREGRKRAVHFQLEN